MQKNKTFKNFSWRFFERFGAQVVSLIVAIVLARILEPSVYGSIALVTVIITILQVFVDSGLGTALIQKKDADDVDFSTVLYSKMVFSFVLYTALFLSAPLISFFYGDKSLTAVIRVLGISIVVGGVKNVEQAYVSRHMLFKAFFWSTLVGTVISAFVGIAMAVSGFGIWALVAQALTNEIIDTILLFIIVKWRPIKAFSFARLKKLSSYGWKLFLASLMDSVYENVRQLVVGKKYTSKDLAFYNRGKQFPSVLVVNLSTSLDSVLLPTMSNVQEKIENVKALVRKSVIVSSYLIFPMMLGMCACSESIILILLTDKWASSIFFMQIFCLAYAFYPANSAFKNGVKSIGRSDIFLITEVIKKAIGIGLIIGSMFFSVEAIAISFLVSSVFNIIVNMYPNKKYLNYNYKEQIADILPSLLLSLSMLLFVFGLNSLELSLWFRLLVMVVFGAMYYFLTSMILKFEGFQYYKTLLSNLFKKKKD